MVKCDRKSSICLKWTRNLNNQIKMIYMDLGLCVCFVCAFKSAGLGLNVYYVFVYIIYLQLATFLCLCVYKINLQFATV